MKLVGRALGRALGAVSPHMRHLGFEIVEVSRGVCVARLPYDRKLIGDPGSGVLHGGVVTTLIDSTAGMAVMARVMRPIALATLDLRIDYLRPSTPGESVTARVECYKASWDVAFVRGVAFNHDEADPVASAAGTFMLRTTMVQSGGHA